MDNTFSVILPNEKATTYKVVTFIIATMSVIGFLLTLMRGLGSNWMVYSVLIPLGQFIGSFLIFLLYKKNKSLFLQQLLTGIFMSGVCWIIIGFYMNGILSLFFSILGYTAVKKIKIDFTEKQIVYPSFPKKTFLWQEVENVLLKEGVLTIDLKNNTLIQFTIKENEQENLNESDFNIFVQQQINSNTINQHS